MKNRLKRIIITTGALLMMTMAPITQSNPLGQYLNEMTTITAQAATTYSDNWKIDGAGVWWYYLNDGSVAKDAWVKDYGEWYLLGSDGAMRTGVFQSNEGKYYLLDTVRNTGTYGKLLKNGAVYQGITLKCDTSEAYEGALSDESIAALKSAGVSFENVPNVENTKHVENGVVTLNPVGSVQSGQDVDNTAPQSQNQPADNSGLTDLSSGAERIPLAPTDKSPIGTKRDGYTLRQWSSADKPHWEKDAVEVYEGKLNKQNWNVY